jgi:hypothetical protein
MTNQANIIDESTKIRLLAKIWKRFLDCQGRAIFQKSEKPHLKSVKNAFSSLLVSER